MGYDLSGKVALVTGTSTKRGIGRAAAVRLAQDGANVVVVSRSRRPTSPPEDDLKEGWKGLVSLVEEIESLGRKCLAVTADVSQSSQVKDMVKQTLDNFGQIDILVNNAGIQAEPRKPVVELEDAVWNRILAINLSGAFYCCRDVSKVMVEKGQGGKIINISSRAGKVGVLNAGPYGASKAGLINLTQTLALELAPHKINVNATCPGPTATEQGEMRLVWSEANRLGIGFDQASARLFPHWLETMPLGSIAQPADQAAAIAFLASSESDHITGIALNVTSGRLMAP